MSVRPMSQYHNANSFGERARDGSKFKIPAPITAIGKMRRQANANSNSIKRTQDFHIAPIGDF
jgi:hypothetical protein